jgi:hypothetical protein
MIFFFTLWIGDPISARASPDRLAGSRKNKGSLIFVNNFISNHVVDERMPQWNQVLEV